MSDSITEAFVQQYSATVTHLAQQKKSRLREGCAHETIKGKRKGLERIGATSMQQRQSRHDDSPMISVPHSKRWISTTFFETGDMIDDADKIRMLIDPASDYVQAFAKAAGRTIDDEINAAFWAATVTGEDAGGSEAFDTGYDIAHNSEGMTVVKLRDGRELLEAAENDEDDGMFRWYCAMNAKQRNAMLGQEKVTSADYATVKALVQGQINQFLGITFLKSQRLTVASSIRSIPLWVKNSMVAGFGKEPGANVARRPDKSFNWYAYYSVDVGGMRRDETGVVRIYCDES
jgi:hypothetical protein